MKLTPIFTLMGFIFLLSACGPNPEQQATLTATAETATAASWTLTSTFTQTFTPTITDTPTFTNTPTITDTPTSTNTPTETPTLTNTPSPTFSFPKVVVNKTLAACLFGPAKTYLWAHDLKLGDTGTVYGRAQNSDWLYVKMDIWGGKWCWISPYVVDLTGDPKTVIVESSTAHLPWANNLYAAPDRITAERQGDQVTVTWSEVWMTQDDDRGYFLDVFVCQNGNLLWMPIGLPDQYHTSYTFTDQPGCRWPSGGKIYTVEKHGYTNPKDIPWPPYTVSQVVADTPTVIPAAENPPTEVPLATEPSTVP